ncbi:MAG: hypothetical protein AB8B58_19885 [Roseobacter sp.]
MADLADASNIWSAERGQPSPGLPLEPLLPQHISAINVDDFGPS